MTIDDRWLAFGDQLRQLREAAGFSGKGLAESVGWQQSKVSRIENGKQAINDADLVTWCRACEVPNAEAIVVQAELRAIRLDEARWKSRLRRGHQALQQSFGDVEQATTHIRVFEATIVPGLVQTPDYARAILSGLAVLRGTRRDAEEAVAARMQRQTILYDTSKQVELLVNEAALRTSVAPADVMVGQIDRLLALPGLRAVRFGILPFGAPLTTTPLHGFWVLDDLLNIEVLHTEITSREPSDVQMYLDLFQSLWAHAAEGEAARALLLAASAEHVRAAQSAHRP